MPGHNYAGPGTNVTQRIERGDKPINYFDAASLIHDVEYDIKEQHIADANMVKNLKRQSGLLPKIIGTAASTTFAIKNALGLYKPQQNKSQGLINQQKAMPLLKDFDMQFDLEKMRSQPKQFATQLRGVRPTQNQLRGVRPLILPPINNPAQEGDM